jgi:hypothetical protein
LGFFDEKKHKLPYDPEELRERGEVKNLNLIGENPVIQKNSGGINRVTTNKSYGVRGAWGLVKIPPQKSTKSPFKIRHVSEGPRDLSEARSRMGM